MKLLPIHICQMRKVIIMQTSRHCRDLTMLAHLCRPIDEGVEGAVSGSDWKEFQVGMKLGG